METIINTINGTYIVPANKLDQLLEWLQNNAIRPGETYMGETQNGKVVGQVLLHEVAQ